MGNCELGGQDTHVLAPRRIYLQKFTFQFSPGALNLRREKGRVSSGDEELGDCYLNKQETSYLRQLLSSEYLCQVRQ